MILSIDPKYIRQNAQPLPCLRVPSDSNRSQQRKCNYFGIKRGIPEKPPHEFRKSPDSNNLTSGDDGEWSEDTLSMMPSCSSASASDSQNIASRLSNTIARTKQIPENVLCGTIHKTAYHLEALPKPVNHLSFPKWGCTLEAGVTIWDTFCVECQVMCTGFDRHRQPCNIQQKN